MFGLLLLVWHAWMVLGLFGPWPVWERLTNDEPIVTGKHPANLYLGMVAARALAATGDCCCYDPAYNAATPVTPIYGGSRLAQLFLLAGGADYQPAAYKIGLALCCLFVPFLLVVAGRGFGLTWGSTLLATAAALMLWWGNPEYHALRNGEIELWLGAIALLAHAGLLVRFHRAASLVGWLGLVLTAALSWFAQPLLLPIFLLLGLSYYLSVGAKHAMLIWHLALLAAETAALAINAFWLRDWISFWWLRTPSAKTSVLAHRTFRSFWESSIWGAPEDRTLAVVILVSGLVGTWLLNHGKGRPAARLLGLGSAALLLLAFLGISCESLGQIGRFGLLVPALWFAAFAAAHAWCVIIRFGQRKLGTPIIIGLSLLLAGTMAIFCHPSLTDFCMRYSRAEPLEIGLGEKEKAVVDKLILHTGPEARILWEDRSGEKSHWPALLAVLTGRSFIGALDPRGTIVHAGIGFSEGSLNGRPIHAWTDLELEDYCRLYNVGWMACWSSAVSDRVQKWPGARKIADLTETGAGALFAVRPHVPSFTLKGQAQVVHADSHHVTLAEVVPEDGVVVLSLHYQAGMRASPARVRIEAEKHAFDPVGFLRLHVAGPVARVTLTWDDR